MYAANTSTLHVMKTEITLRKATRKALELMKKGHVSAYIEMLVIIDQLKHELRNAQAGAIA
jgi:hypothetical protein